MERRGLIRRGLLLVTPVLSGCSLNNNGDSESSPEESDPPDFVGRTDLENFEVDPGGFFYTQGTSLQEPYEVDVEIVAERLDTYTTVKIDQINIEMHSEEQSDERIEHTEGWEMSTGGDSSANLEIILEGEASIPRPLETGEVILDSKHVSIR